MDIKLDDWTQEYILSLLSKGIYECDYFDFKEMLPDSRDDRGKERLITVCGSFANSDGGFLVFGIKDDRSLPAKDRLVGMDRTIDFPAIFGSFPQKCEPSIHWIPNAIYQEIDIDVAQAKKKGTSPNNCELTDLEDSIFHEFNHARENTKRFFQDGDFEYQDNLLLNQLFKDSLIYKK